MLVNVYDPTAPRRSATTTITVEVLRNINSPRFPQIPGGYQITIGDDTKTGSIVFEFNATDADGVFAGLREEE